MRKGKLKFTIGIARSGKSTYCTRWYQYLEDGVREMLPRAIVCADDIRMEVHGERYNRHAEPVVWTIHTYMIRALLRRGHDVIIDGTNTTEDSIQRILQINHDADYVLIDTDVSVCKSRAIASGQADLIERGVIDRQSQQLELLKVEGVDAVVERVRKKVRERWQPS
jgi:predicted kinase